jgi:hypothetical protein
VILKSRTLSRTCDATETRNPCVIKVILLACFTYNYLAISRSSSAWKSVEIFWAEIYWGRLFIKAECSLIQSSCRSFIRVIVPYEISKLSSAYSTLCKHVLCSTLTHSTNEDLLNIKRKCDPEVSYPLSYVRCHWNPEPAHPVQHKVSRFFRPRYIGDDFLLGPTLVSFNRAVVPLFELSFLTKSQKLTSA